MGADERWLLRRRVRAVRLRQEPLVLRELLVRLRPRHRIAAVHGLAGGRGRDCLLQVVGDRLLPRLQSRWIVAHEVSRLAHRLFAILGVENGLSRSEEHTSELQSLMRISYAVFCFKKK